MGRRGRCRLPATTPVLFRGADVAGFDGLIVKDGGTLLFLALMDLAALVAIVLSRDGDCQGPKGRGVLRPRSLRPDRHAHHGRRPGPPGCLPGSRDPGAAPLHPRGLRQDGPRRDGGGREILSPRQFLVGPLSAGACLLLWCDGDHGARGGPRGPFHRRPCFSRGWLL